MSVVEILNNNVALTFTGTWTTNNTNSPSGGGGSNTRSGSFKSSNTTGDTVTWLATGRDLFVNIVHDGSYGKFAVTIDGVAQPGFFSGACTSASGSIFQTLTKLNTQGRLTDGAHTVVLTVVGGNPLAIDSFVAVTGSLISPTAGALTALGDSWTANYGIAADFGFMSLILREMANQGVSLTLTNRAVSGSCLASTYISPASGMAKVLANLAADAPQYLTILFGLNDLANPAGNTYYGVGDYLKYYDGLLQFLQAAFDVNNMVVTVGTPQWALGLYYGGGYQIPNGTNRTVSVSSLERYEGAVQSLRKLLLRYPWVRIANIYEALDYNADLLYPNNAGDFGLHPNEAGNAVVAEEFVNAMLGYNVGTTRG